MIIFNYCQSEVLYDDEIKTRLMEVKLNILLSNSLVFPLFDKLINGT